MGYVRRLLGRLNTLDRSLLLLFAGLAVVFLAILPPANFSSDGDAMLDVATSLASGDGFRVPCDPDRSIAGHDGACYSTYYPLLSILAVPFVFVGRTVADLGGVSPDFTGEALAMVVPALAAAGAGTVTAMLALRFGAGRRAAVLGGVALGFGTEILIYARTFYAETPAALLLGLVVWGFTGTARDRRWGMLATVLLILAKPQLALVGGAVGLVVAARARTWRPLVDAAVASVIGAVVYGAYNWLRFRDVTNLGGDARELRVNAYGWDAVEALGLLTISPARGLLWFSPVVLAGIYVLWRRRRETTALACAAAFLGALVVAVGNPGTGWSWGSRYLAPTLPLFVAAAVTLRGRGARIVAVLVAIGFVIGLPTTVAFYERYYQQNAEFREASERYWTFPEGILVRVWPETGEQLAAAADTDVDELVHAGTDAPEGDEDPLLNIVALWWWVLPAMGIPWVAGLLVCLAMIAGGVWLLVRALRTAQRDQAAATASPA